MMRRKEAAAKNHSVTIASVEAEALAFRNESEVLRLELQALREEIASTMTELDAFSTSMKENAS